MVSVLTTTVASRSRNDEFALVLLWTWRTGISRSRTRGEDVARRKKKASRRALRNVVAPKSAEKAKSSTMNSNAIYARDVLLRFVWRSAPVLRKVRKTWNIAGDSEGNDSGRCDMSASRLARLMSCQYI